jgi:uncharacterized membrane protein (DUF485 family)
MLHEPAGQSGPDPAAAYKARLGIWMFLLYCVVYAGFVVINLARPVLMERIVVAGLNLAVVYGMGLILFAVVLAFIYDWACRRREAAPSDTLGKGGRG